MTSAPLTPPALTALKGERRLVALTAYTAPMAEMLDEHVDILLVGDSMGMVLYGMESTLGVTPQMIAEHSRAVVSRTKHACVVADLPFGSYQQSKEQAYETAAMIMQHSGAAAVKLEGGAEMAETIAFLSERAIPVMAHIGLMPQHVHSHGGYRYQGRTEAERTKIMTDAKAVSEAGAFAVIMECMDKALAANITATLNIPTIGIGAGAACDGQILVTEDMLGYFEKNAKFVKHYAQLRSTITRAVKDYADEVRDGSYPEDKHSFGG